MVIRNPERKNQGYMVEKYKKYFEQIGLLEAG
jgi:hypothetical protein